MTTHFLLGCYYEWIHIELVLILERDFQKQSHGFKARAKQILRKVKSKK